MKAEYDFSKGQRNKFYIPEDKIRLPFYLDPKTEKRIKIQAEKPGKSPTDLVYAFIENELRLIESVEVNVWFWTENSDRP